MKEDVCSVNGVTTVVVIGASGFIGQHLLNVLSQRKDVELRILVHRYRIKKHSNLNFIEGDLLAPDSLDGLFKKNCTVINLAYLSQNNLEAITNLAMCCAKNQVARLIHCSTAVVVGRSEGDWVDERTRARPNTEYEKTKLKIEEVLLEISRGRFEISILRPTAVFGPGGKNLIKLADELMTENAMINYTRSCLFRRRSMNLVCVDNVVAAIIFLQNAVNVDRELFIISDDDSPMNNYRDVEKRLLMCFGKSQRIPKLFVPEFVLRMLLRLAGKSNINPSSKYSDNKLRALGFNKPQNLETGIDVFAEYYKNSRKV